MVSLVEFPVIQLLGSLEVAAVAVSGCGAEVSSNSASRKLGSIRIVQRTRPFHVSSNSASRKLGR